MRRGVAGDGRAALRRRPEERSIARVSATNRVVDPSLLAARRRSRGNAAERAVVTYLEARGFEIVATNLRVGHYELDVVARSGPLVVVVEVRTRGVGSWTSAFGSLDPGKRRRIRRAGEWLWQRRYRSDSTVERLRFDAASVSFETGAPVVEYVPAAF